MNLDIFASCAIENDGRAWIYWHEVIKHLASESVGALLIIVIKIGIFCLFLSIALPSCGLDAALVSFVLSFFGDLTVIA